jgi:hypothetical protein
MPNLEKLIAEEAGTYQPLQSEIDNEEVLVGRLSNWGAIAKYMWAGCATLTLKSHATQTRFTYRIAQAKNQTGKREGDTYFVSVLTGQNNESDFTYAGILDKKTNSFRFTGKSKFTADTPSMVAFTWFARRFAAVAAGLETAMPERLEIWHEGRCGRCGRKLTVPGSIESGLGPECAQK